MSDASRAPRPARALAPGELVREFCATWERGGFDRFGDFLSADAVFHMLPLEPVRGLEAIRQECQKMAALGTVRVRILRMAASGGVVFTERIDALERADGIGELAVVGVFEVENGRIVAWRDYFDLRQALEAFGLDAPF
jgi:limonene-1,2-epoxide hydrolase